MPDMEGSVDEGVKGFKDSEDERTTALTNGFEVNLPPNGSNIVAPIEVICSSQDKIEDGEYVSDEFGSSYLDEFDDDKGKGPKFEKFKKKHLNNDYQLKWGMQFNTLADFKDTIRELSILNGRKFIFVENFTLSSNKNSSLIHVTTLT